MTATTRANRVRPEFEPVYHRYGPHRAGLPPLIPYFRELWKRRAFAAEMSKATMRGANTSTFFGQAWLVLNPLLLAAVYYVLVTIIRRQSDPAFFAHLTLGIFAFQLVGHSVTSGATSVTSFGFGASEGGSQEPGAQETRAHSRLGFIDNVEQRSC